MPQRRAPSSCVFQAVCTSATARDLLLADAVPCWSLTRTRSSFVFVFRGFRWGVGLNTWTRLRTQYCRTFGGGWCCYLASTRKPLFNFCNSQIACIYTNSSKCLYLITVAVIGLLVLRLACSTVALMRQMCELSSPHSVPRAFVFTSKTFAFAWACIIPVRTAACCGRQRYCNYFLCTLWTGTSLHFAPEAHAIKDNGC